MSAATARLRALLAEGRRLYVHPAGHGHAVREGTTQQCELVDCFGRAHVAAVLAAGNLRRLPDEPGLPCTIYAARPPSPPRRPRQRAPRAPRFTDAIRPAPAGRTVLRVRIVSGEGGRAFADARPAEVRTPAARTLRSSAA